jgi:hypothetical protein
MNEHDAMTLFLPKKHEFRQVVDVESEEVRSALRGLPAGASIPLSLEAVSGRGAGWRVTGFESVTHD